MCLTRIRQKVGFEHLKAGFMNLDKFWKVNLGTKGEIAGNCDDRVLFLQTI